MPGEGPGGTRTWIGLTGLSAEVSRTAPDIPLCLQIASSQPLKPTRPAEAALPADNRRAAPGSVH
jgi:hypothetical protein